VDLLTGYTLLPTTIELVHEQTNASTIYWGVSVWGVSVWVLKKKTTTQHWFSYFQIACKHVTPFMSLNH